MLNGSLQIHAESNSVSGGLTQGQRLIPEGAVLGPIQLLPVCVTLNSDQ